MKIIRYLQFEIGATGAVLVHNNQLGPLGRNSFARDYVCHCRMWYLTCIESPDSRTWRPRPFIEAEGLFLVPMLDPLDAYKRTLRPGEIDMYKLEYPVGTGQWSG